MAEAFHASPPELSLYEFRMARRFGCVEQHHGDKLQHRRCRAHDRARLRLSKDSRACETSQDRYAILFARFLASVCTDVSPAQHVGA
eukprot:360946-Chlamydomonas_euryale.AAC.5